MKHRFLVETEQIRGETVSFSAEQSHQIRNVLRLRMGDAVRVFDGVQPVDRVVILDGTSTGRVSGTRGQAPEPGTRLLVYPALLQRDKFEPVLQKLTEIGAASIVPVLTTRGLVRDPPDDRKLARWRAILREAAEQSGRGIVPELRPALHLQEAIAEAAAEGVAVMAYEGERRHTLKDALHGAPRPVSLFVGPEGGYDSEEVALAVAAGAHLVTLGPRVLRTETASPLLAALVLYELGDLSCEGDDPRS